MFSCYVISIQLLLLFIARWRGKRGGKNLHFNTTLVIVYQPASNSIPSLISFQYNSCYCLSAITQPIHALGSWISIQLLLLFITRRQAKRWIVDNFNTTLVIVYRQGKQERLT